MPYARSWQGVGDSVGQTWLFSLLSLWSTLGCLLGNIDIKETDTYKQYYKLYQVLWRKIIECYEKNQWSDLMHIGQ